jgi:hypothetical protein
MHLPNTLAAHERKQTVHSKSLRKLGEPAFENYLIHAFTGSWQAQVSGALG